jgi:hypothetical protein
MKLLHPAFLICTLLLSGCATDNNHILDMGNETQLQKRSYQSRTFETNDKEKVLRATISTLQDLGFLIERADLELGAVSGTKLEGLDKFRITISVRKKGTDRMLVRANAQANVKRAGGAGFIIDIHAIDDPKQYQNFFSLLEKSLFLTAHAGE